MILKVMAPTHSPNITHQSITRRYSSRCLLNTLSPSNLANTGNCGQRKGESNIEHIQKEVREKISRELEEGKGFS